MYPYRCDNDSNIIPRQHEDEQETAPPMYNEITDTSETVAEPEYTEPIPDLGGMNDQADDDPDKAAKRRSLKNISAQKFSIFIKGGLDRGYFGPWPGP